MYITLSLPQEKNDRIWNDGQTLQDFQSKQIFITNEKTHESCHASEVDQPILVSTDADCSPPPVYPQVERLLCKLYELCQVLPVTLCFHLQSGRQRGQQFVVRPHVQLGSLVSDRDPSVLIARRLEPLPESEETLSERQHRLPRGTNNIRSSSATSNEDANRRHEWYVRKCYARELRIIQKKSPTAENLMEDSACARTPASLIE